VWPEQRLGLDRELGQGRAVPEPGARTMPRRAGREEEPAAGSMGRRNRRREEEEMWMRMTCGVHPELYIAGNLIWLGCWNWSQFEEWILFK
jgi:hypothetical protein